MKLVLIAALLLCGGCITYFGEGELRKDYIINEPCFGCCEKALSAKGDDAIKQLLECSNLQGCVCN